MRAWIIMGALALAVVGCDDKKGADESSASAKGSKKLDAIKVPAHFKEKAAKEINGDNVDAKVEKLENEILADAKKKYGIPADL